MYRNGLQGTVREYLILTEFAIRNLTNESVIITRVEIDEPALPPLPGFDVVDNGRAHTCAYDPKGDLFPRVKETEFVAYDAQAFYEWKTKEEKDRTEVDYATLEPKGPTTVAYVAMRRFAMEQK